MTSIRPCIFSKSLRKGLKMLKHLLVLLAFLLVLTPVSFAKTITFAQVSDVHYSPDGKTMSSRNVEVSKKHLFFTITSLNKKNPMFTVFLGDQTDKSTEDSLNDFLGYTSKLKMPYYFVFGNHDAYKMSGVEKERYLEIVSKINPRQPKKQNYFVFKPNKDIACIVLDGSAKLVPSSHGYFQPEQLLWLDKQLKKNKNKIVFIFQHFPLITPHENKSHDVLEAYKYWYVLSRHKNVVLISSGHYHDEAFNVDKYGIRHISTTSLLNVPPEYDLVTVEYDKDSHKDAKQVKVDVEHVRV